MRYRGVTPSSSAGYIPHNGNWCMCDLCGLRFRAFEMRTQVHGPHKGFLVCPADYDKKNPQWDEIEAIPEKIVPNIVNIEPDSVEVNVAYDYDRLLLADEESMFLLTTGGEDGMLLASDSVDESATWVTGDDL